MFRVHSLTMRGRRAVAAGRSSQDCATGARLGQYAVLCVADGLSHPTRGHESRTELGSLLLCKAALNLTMQHLDDGGLPEALAEVGAQLAKVMVTVDDALGPEQAAGTLPATLVIGILQHEGADIWAAGDGEAFVATIPSTSVDVVAGEPDETDEGLVWSSHDHRPLIAGSGADALRCVLAVRGPLEGGYVSTDGLAEAARVQRLLRQVPGIEPRALAAELCDRRLAPGNANCSITGDDIGVAWASRVREGHEGLPRRRFTAKEDRQAQHIHDSYVERGVPSGDAWSRAYGTIQNQRKRARMV